MASASGVFLAFLSLTLFTGVLAATENLEPSALPTLPPANPDISKDPCAFSDIDKLMYRLENTSLSYNTSLLVETCDDICRLLYGVGNPDILGIGAMVSYALQGIVAMTFGPCLLIIYMFWGETRHGLFKLLLRLTIPTHRANAFTAVCVLISLAIRLFDKAPAFERRFCGTFAVYQLFVSGVGIAFYFFFHRFKDRVQSILFIALFGASVISCLAGFGVQMLHIPGAMNVLAGRTEGGAEFFSSPPQKIFTDCHEMKGFPWVHPGEDNFASGEVTGLCVGSIVLLLGFVVLFIWKQKRLDQANKHASTSSRFSRFNLVRTALLILPFLIAACTGSALVRMFMAMQKIRQDIQKYGKDEYEDNEWGFGQVMAVIVWVQYVGDLVTILIAAFTNDDEEKTSQVEREDVAPAANINQPRREASQATSSSPVPDQTGNMDSVEQVSAVFYIWSNLSNGLAIKPIFGCRDAHNAGTPKVNLDQEWGWHVPTGMTFVVSPRGMDISLEEHAGSEDDAITPILGHQGQGLRGEVDDFHTQQTVMSFELGMTMNGRIDCMGYITSIWKKTIIVGETS